MSGMDDHIGKPFTSQELWRCLLKYFKPVTWRDEDETYRKQIDKDLHQKLTENFIKLNSEKSKEIKNAIETGDFVLAHRLAHTLGGNAGQLGKEKLQKAAENVENNLKNGSNLTTPEQIEVLEKELNDVLTELTSLVEELSPNESVTAESVDTSEAKKLLDELEPLLKRSDSESLALTDGLRSISGSENLIQLIESFSFESAYEELIRLMEKLQEE